MRNANAVRQRYRDPRSEERIRHHYDVERELATKLKTATKAERLRLYRECYDELFSRVPDHPQLLRRRGDDGGRIDWQLRLLRPLVDAEDVYLEIGAGDCRLAFAMCQHVKRCYAIDVSEVIARHARPPENFRLVISDGTSIGVPAGSVDLAFSNQLMEHLHPDDASEQLSGIYAALRQGGRYLCVTPNRLSGPHDVSAYFDDVATGFHLKEYTYSELVPLLREVGFTRVRALLVRGGRTLGTLPLGLAGAIEGALGALPPRLRRRLARTRPARLLLGVAVLAEK